MVQNTPCWDTKERVRLQNKTQLTKNVRFFFVLHLPVQHLFPSMAYFEPFDLILQGPIGSLRGFSYMAKMCARSRCIG